MSDTSNSAPSPQEVAKMTGPELAEAEGLTNPAEGEVAQANAELADALSQMQAEDPEGLSLRGDTEEQAFEGLPPQQPPPPPPQQPPPPPPAPAPSPPAQSGQELLSSAVDQQLGPKGPRPAGVQDKHWVPDPNDPNQGQVNIGAMAKSYSDLQAAFSQRGRETQALPAGDYFGAEEVAQLNSLGAHVEDSTDPTLQAFAQAASEVGLSKEQAISLASSYTKHASAMLPNPPAEAPVPDLASELAKIGPEGANIELGNAQRIMAQHQSGRLSVSDVQVLARVNQTAEGITALSKLLNMGQPNLPSVSSAPTSEQMTESEFNKAVENLDMSDKGAWNELLKKGQNMRLGA